MKLPSFAFLLDSIIGSARRFPLPALVTLAGTGMALALVDNQSPNELLIKAFLIALLALPVSIAWAAFYESGFTSLRIKFGLLIALTVVIGVYAWFLHPRTETFQYVGLGKYIALMVAAHLWVSVSPYLNKRRVSDFWEYNRELFSNFVVGAAYTLILFGGLSLAMAATSHLFDVNINGDNYLRLFILLVGLFNTFFFLHHFPKVYEYEAEQGSYNLVFKTLCLYILMPIVAIYFIILYAYGFKIAFTGDLPKGWVASLVISFSVAGIFTYLLSFRLPDFVPEKLARLYLRLFWWVLVPLTGLLFVGISRRINDYGVTEERYLVAATGVWLAGISLYFIMSKKDNIKVIPISLALVALYIAFGPFNAFQVSANSQARQLKTLLADHGSWDGLMFKPVTLSISSENASRLYDILLYLSRRDELKQLDAHFPGGLEEVMGISQNANEKAVRIQKWLKVENTNNYYDPSVFHISSNRPNIYGEIDVRGYSFIYFVLLYHLEPATENSERYFTLSKEKCMLEWRDPNIKENGGLIDQFDFSNIIKDWYANGSETSKTLETNELITVSGKKTTLTLIIRSADLKSNMDGELYFTHLEAAALIK